MPRGIRALDLALELSRDPTLASAMREQSLPEDTIVVIRIAGGCNDTIGEAVRMTGAPAETLKEAAILYLQKVLLAPNSDCYRTLGVFPEASGSQMREHVRWLMLWLHPDRNPNEWESVFAERVLKAWREARTTRRLGGEETKELLADAPLRGRRRLRLVRPRWVALPISEKDTQARWPRAAVLILISGLALALFAAPAISLVSSWLTSETAEAMRPR
jgi:hypothetical protein